MEKKIRNEKCSAFVCSCKAHMSIILTPLLTKMKEVILEEVCMFPSLASSWPIWLCGVEDAKVGSSWHE